jgi:prolyl oligopeptidase
MRPVRHTWILILALLVPATQPVSAQSDNAGARLHALFKAEWEYTLQENPVFASILGDRRYNDRWPDASAAAVERRYQHALEAQKQLAAIPFAELSEMDRVNYRLFQRELESQVEGHRYRLHLLAINHMEGIQTLNDLVLQLPFATGKDYADWIARLRALPALLDQNIALLREGIRAGIVHPQVIIQRVPAQVEKQFAGKPEESLFYQVFRDLPADIPEAERARLRKEAQQAIGEQVLPAYRRLHEFLTREYLPACKEQVGISQIPRGREAYAYLARSFTTTPLAPDEIHEIGQREVRRIRAEMKKVIAQTGFQGSFAEFLHFLRTDPQFYYSDPQELLAAYRALSKRIDPTLVKLFGKIPRAPYGVEPVPDTIAPDTTTAYYNQPAADGTRPGTYYVNLYKPEVRPKYEMEALSIHEAVPGHHLQIALAMELGELPEFRRYGGYTVFVEGWALYSESLGEELGFYKDPYSKFGQLTYEMWRAVRLVVDTGLHVKGWTREQAIEFFKANAAKTEQDIVNEIDRYIAWPGQALAYKIGELKIKELRARAATELGERFDVRAFHDTVLGSGAVTLDVLEANVNAWIARVKQKETNR